MLGSPGKFKLWGKAAPPAQPVPAAEAAPLKEHPAVAALREAIIKLDQLPINRDSLLQIFEGRTPVWNQALAAYRSLCIQSQYEEALAKALADYAETAINLHVRAIAYAGDSLSLVGRESATASGMRYWRIRKQIQSTSGERFAALNEIPGRLLAATGMQRQELAAWFDGMHTHFREASQEFMIGVHLDTLPFTSLSLIQAEVVFRFFERIGPELRLVASADDPQRARAESVAPAVQASGMGGLEVKNIYIDFSALRSRLLDLTGALRRDGIPVYLQGFTKNPAILVAMLVPVLTHWSAQKPTRKADRIKERGELEVVLGVPDVLRSMRGEAPSNVDIWTRTDHHGEGVGALTLSLNKAYQPGSLIGLRLKDSETWHVGVIRRINRIDGGRYSIGVQHLNRVTPRMFEIEIEPGKLYQSYCLHMDQAVIVNRAQIPQGRLLKIYADKIIMARNFSIAEVGGNYELHLLAEE